MSMPSGLPLQHSGILAELFPVRATDGCEGHAAWQESVGKLTRALKPLARLPTSTRPVVAGPCSPFRAARPFGSLTSDAVARKSRTAPRPDRIPNPQQQPAGCSASTELSLGPVPFP